MTKRNKMSLAFDGFMSGVLLYETILAIANGPWWWAGITASGFGLFASSVIREVMRDG